jgi:tRNA G18 (ribose-2'-O)-methylase SpoU
VRGFCGIGILNSEKDCNVGTLWRTAHSLGAAFIFTVGRKYELQSSDTTKAHRTVPYFHYADFNDFYQHLPNECRLVGIENNAEAVPIQRVVHPERAVYLLGSEGSGLTNEAISKCMFTIVLPGIVCLNVAVAGSLVLFDRIQKGVT